MAVKNLAATLSSPFLAVISPSSTWRSSSGSVPSIPICRPRLRNGASISLPRPSRPSTGPPWRPPGGGHQGGGAGADGWHLRRQQRHLEPGADLPDVGHGRPRDGGA